MKIRRILAAAAAAFVLVIFLPSCEGETNEDGKINISVTIAPEKEFVERISGGKASVNIVVPAGSDPESYEPSVEDIKALADADIYFAIGVPSEDNSILPMVGGDTLTVRLDKAVSEKIPDLYIGDERDPHIWLSVDRVMIMAEEICSVLSDVDPNGAPFYKKNLEAYQRELSDAKAYASETLRSLDSRSIIVYHPAFGYFADEHALTMYALENEGKEATLKELTSLIDYARENDIKAIFYQEEAGKKQPESFANEIDGVAVRLSPLSENYVEGYKEIADKIKEFSK